MTLLFPLFLAAAAAVIAPILLHLRRQPPKTKVEFSSLQFLMPTPMVTTTRSKIERWLLLALRCLALLLLAAMFARPFVADQKMQDGKGKAVLVLVDRSASMQQSDHFAKAQAKAREWLRKGDRVAVATFDRQLQKVSTFAAVPALPDLQCGWAGTDLGRALVEAVGWINEVPGVAEKQIVVVSDFQDGANVEALRGFAWPETVTLVTEVIAPKDTNNLSASLVVGVADSDEVDARKASTMLRVRVANARDSKAEQFALKWPDGSLAAEGQLPPGATRVLRVPRPEAAAPQVLQLSGDGWAFDNAVHVAPPQPRIVKVVTLTGDKDAGSVESPMFYLSRAMVPTSKLAPEVVKGGGAETLKNAAWVVMTNDAAPMPELRPWLENGGRALCVVTGTEVKMLAALIGSAVKIDEADVKDFALLSEVDYAHPVMKPFEDGRLRDFTKIHFWKHRTLAADGVKMEVVARFDNNAPAVLSLTMGKGRLVILLSGWQPRDSQLALSSKFVPLLYGMLGEAGVSLEQPAQFVVGDALPDGVAEKPGFVKTKDGRTLAVNLPPEESRINPMDLGKLVSLGVKMKSETVLPVKDQERLANEDLEAKQQYWLIALALLLAVLSVETWLAGRKLSAGTLDAA
jgi:hypothetical protein